jgi:hypothetical protein
MCREPQVWVLEAPLMASPPFHSGAAGKPHTCSQGPRPRLPFRVLQTSPIVPAMFPLAIPSTCQVLSLALCPFGQTHSCVVQHLPP